MRAARPSPVSLHSSPHRCFPSTRRAAAKKSSDLDFAAFERRLVALELLYEGHAYDGFARQESSPRTVEVRRCA